ncbi:sodium:solute symporter family protein [Dethiobacter alkaliphilus]|uniref:Na+/solute symporter n=1 Tax=Dethiobacter alkaliphilus AHT 1 TaxID=555088 RepID=C0GCL0_DETAL|nr:sodium:solute symporter family protein [Dethiobacter alkaliphilus]EEG78945.1 Na+/solute symporter [Dethiobacter alkaliphilus AHT 1]
MNITTLTIVILIYLAIMTGLMALGYKKTKTDADYMVAGRSMHPWVMALSYGAAFISTSAIIGFGGAAGLFGFSLLWLTVLTIFVGIFIAFAVFGVRIRRMSCNLNCDTFPSMLGTRFQSKGLTAYAGLLIFLLMPAYTSAILIGGARFLQDALAMPFNISLLILAVLVGIYVVSGGLRGVMYTDAFFAVVMLIGMAALLLSTYNAVGGIIPGHTGLSALASMVPEALTEQGHRGWTAMPAVGSSIWWTVISTMVLGVGIGVLAQPQLTMRFMTVKQPKSIYQAILVGGIFIFFMTGTAFIVGPLSNLYFVQNQGQIALQVAEGNMDRIIPIFVSQIMPNWFLYFFMLSLLSAAVSTLVSLLHVQGAAFARDLVDTLGAGKLVPQFGTRHWAKAGVLVSLLAAVVLAYVLPAGVIARATAFWFGICAAAFLPTLTAALYWPAATKAGALASTISGSLISGLGYVLLKEQEAVAIGLVSRLFDRATLLPFPWTHIDPLIYALPISAVVLVVVSLVTQKPAAQHLKDTFDKVA